MVMKDVREEKGSVSSQTTGWYLIRPWKEPRHVHEGQDGDVERVQEPDEAGRLSGVGGGEKVGVRG